MPWYKTGTVKTTINTNAIVGTGTSFIANARVGDAFKGPDGAWYEITNIASDTALSIAPNYAGPTIASGTYAITPVQGYVKDLADQAKAMILQWGATLAGLGTVSTENIVPIAKGGTGATTVANARTALGLGPLATATIVPAENGGTGFDALVGTGKVFERGTNAKGEYTKFVDGTLITWGKQIINGAVVAGQGVTWLGSTLANQPSPFVGTPISDVNYSMMTAADGGGTPIYTMKQSYYQNGETVQVGVNMGTGPSSSHPQLTYGTQGAGSCIVVFTSTGRWK